MARIAFDPAKGSWTIQTRGIDFEDAGKAFDGPTLTVIDDRHDYGEIRYQTYALLEERLVMIIWTPRGDDRRIISMRHCHAPEERDVRPNLR